MANGARGKWKKCRKRSRASASNRLWLLPRRAVRTGARSSVFHRTLVPRDQRHTVKWFRVLCVSKGNRKMSRFIIGPHMRLQEWVAEEKGYFKDEGLDYEFISSTGFSQLSVKSATELPKDQIKGAYQTIEQGRTCDISSACHWTINMAAAAGHGKLWSAAYSVD